MCGAFNITSEAYGNFEEFFISSLLLLRHFCFLVCGIFVIVSNAVDALTMIWHVFIYSDDLFYIFFVFHFFPLFFFRCFDFQKSNKLWYASHVKWFVSMSFSDYVLILSNFIALRKSSNSFFFKITQWTQLNCRILFSELIIKIPPYSRIIFIRNTSNIPAFILYWMERNERHEKST